jgi:hypothetical protein
VPLPIAATNEEAPLEEAPVFPAVPPADAEGLLWERWSDFFAPERPRFLDCPELALATGGVD